MKRKNKKADSEDYIGSLWFKTTIALAVISVLSYMLNLFIFNDINWYLAINATIVAILAAYFATVLRHIEKNKLNC